MGYIRFIVLSALLLPAAGAQEESGGMQLVETATGIVAVLRANIRSGPSKTYNIMLTVDGGSELTVRSFKDGWFEVELPAGAAAWVYNRWIRVEIPEGIAVDPANPHVGVVVGRRVRVRAAPDMQSTVLMEKNRKETVQIIGQVGDWFKIKPPAGTRGWIWSELVELDEGVRVAGMPLPSDAAEAVVGNLDPLPGVTEPPLPRGDGEIPPTALGRQSVLREAEMLFAQEFERPELERDFRRLVSLYNRVLDDAGATQPDRDTAAARLKQIFRMLPRKALLGYMLELSQKVDAEMRQIEQRYQPTIEVFRSKLPVSRYTARGVLYEAEPGQRLYRYRLKLADVTLYLIRTDRVDLDRLVGRKVGVIGQTMPAPPGETAEILDLADIELAE